jgi:hypothetical protein
MKLARFDETFGRPLPKRITEAEFAAFDNSVRRDVLVCVVDAFKRKVSTTRIPLGFVQLAVLGLGGLIQPVPSFADNCSLADN